MGANDSLIFLEDSDGSKDFGIAVLLVFKVLQCCRDAVLFLEVENHFESFSVVVDFIDDSHRLLLLRDNSSDNDYLTVS